MDDGELVIATLERLEEMQHLLVAGDASMFTAVGRLLDVDDQAAEMLMRAAARVTDHKHQTMRQAGEVDWNARSTVWAVALVAGIELATALHKAREEGR